ncbi:MAG: 2-C-methyl-D-erythritol 4-phosphate cytidylyltransferase [Bacteroidales bacterium]|nr:2-C-methyl-D-erythritol 4-phosphate cytidylyltransferase [Bacteroidales bacterium]
MKDYVIITAGGTGSRMKSDIPKQFLLLKGKPILMHSIERFFNYNNDLNIVISLPEEFISYWKNLCDKHKFAIEHTVVKGGTTRFNSIKNALQEVKGAGLVAVHDGVRPLVSGKTIENTYKTARLKGNAVASRDIYFSLRKTEGLKNFAINRNDYKEIQTPQTFESELLKEAYSLKYEESFTDDAAVVERLGVTINLIEGNPENIKITAKNDLIIAEALINRIC